MLIGEILEEQGHVSAEGLNRARTHQLDKGGSFTEALMALELVTPEQLAEATAYVPRQPETLEETGLEEAFLTGLVLKSMYVYGRDTAAAVAGDVALPRHLVRTLMEGALDHALLQALGFTRRDQNEMRYNLTDKGRDWAVEALKMSQYVGPAPVPIKEYYAQVEKQRVGREFCSLEALQESFSDLTLERDLLARVGPAINSGQSVLLYGPPGNGKTSIAERVARTFNHSIYIPHCIEVDGQVIKIFDTAVHQEIEEKPVEGSLSPLVTNDVFDVDRRWVRCKRPMVITGGELTLDMLDLSFNEYAKYYEGPLQIKATNGVFLIDDFGRQLVSPKEVLNRWIVPLERGVDFLTLHTGKKFPIVFNELVVFSTNIPPLELMDAGQLRRIYYKIQIEGPTREDLETIFRDEARKFEVALPDTLIDYIYRNFYEKGVIPVARFHPRYVIDQVRTRCAYENVPFALEEKYVEDVLHNLYVVQ